MDLRDRLAVQRTVLANQRTLLTFFNSALGSFVSGVTLIKFIGTVFFFWLGWALIGASLALLGCGFVNYARHQKALSSTPKP